MRYPIPRHFLQVLIDKHTSEWFFGPARGREHQVVRWIKVAELPPSALIVGLSDEGYWVRGGGPTIEVADGPQAITLLPCLEYPSSIFRSALSIGLAKCGLPESLDETFPLDDLIIAGLQSGSEYWTKLALERLGEVGATLATRDALRFAARSAPTQPLRHRAKTLIRV